ncbi:hypothetical protein A2803_05630 [Candidatus Woesebacteria bacterium RIFCSPHIGHO2_01_FULL_44_21]|uniref:RNA polymerase sigma-70 region 4 domain-containing protein n=1 Tax=Candidatus Woesebacteria bacterium RIFCSPHIGHO2_01_FULL_44_21 TaxID=1802503 RepID=A0A1F7YZZ9_9BACT|nr:MAG: hypothetical protein A2803_05630 [Candidatus Woesebacteria bacterium RIFCSPHIGHO2_01_FULL_44_21]OGM71125.1 MAG: hypothetical protein A2897_02795 [Candidatus Woesebacteria bacterium RIFCSPLOWO2_01_FULL_44_24b]
MTSTERNLNYQLPESEFYQNLCRVLEPELGDEANDIMLKAVRGVYDFVTSDGSIKAFWDELDQDQKLSDLLTTPQKDLGDNTILAFVRKQVQTNKREVENLLGIEHAEESQEDFGPTHSQPRRRSRLKIDKSDKPDDRYLASKGYLQVSELEDLAAINRKTRILHISKPPLLSQSSLERILDQAPELEVIQVPPSIMTTHVSQAAKKILSEKGIEIRVQRDRNSVYYDEGIITEEHENKRKFVVEALKDPEKKLFLAELRKYEFPEIDVADAMFLSSKSNSMVKIAEELGISYHSVQNGSNAVLLNLGFTDIVASRYVDRAKALRNKLERVKRAETDRIQWDEFRNGFIVGEKLPPEDLPIGRWEMWRRLVSYLADNDNALENLRATDERSYNVIVEYYELSAASSKTTLKEIGQRYGIGHERVRQLKNEVLSRWGLLDEE